MAQAIATTQNQNSQLTKSFIAAFAGVLLAVPIVTVMTTAIVKAQLGAVTDSVVRSLSVQPAASQQNTAIAPASCVDESLKNSGSASQGNSSKTVSGWKHGGSTTNSFNQTNTSTTTNNVSVDKSKVITKTYQDSFNVGSNNGNFSNNNSGNAINSNNGNFANNGNTINSNNNIGNTVNSGNAINSGNVVNSGNSINSNNTIYNDNDLIDIL